MKLESITLLMFFLYHHFIENALKPSLWILLEIQNSLKAYPEVEKEKGTYTHLLTRYHNRRHIWCLGYLVSYLLTHFDRID